MRTLTAPTTLVTERPYAAPVLLVTITTTSGKVFRVSDRTAVLNDGTEYLPLVQNMGELQESLNGFDGGGAPATFDLVFFNAKPLEGKSRFSDLIQTPRNTSGAYDFTNARVDVDRLEEGHTASDLVRLQTFYLEHPTGIGDNLITLRMSDLANKIEDALPITKITRALFPAAPRDAIETEIRRPLGVLKNVVAQPIIDGSISTLTAAIDDNDTSLALADASDVPSSGTGLFKSGEIVTWVGKAGQTLLNLTRGASSTTAESHAQGDEFLYIRTDEYRFVVGEGASRLAAPVNLVTDGAFDSDLGAWVPTEVNTGVVEWVATGGGQMRLNRPNPGDGAFVTRDVTAVVGKQYRVTATLTALTGSGSAFAVGSSTGGSQLHGTTLTTPQTYSVIVTATTTTISLLLSADNTGVTALYDNVSIELVDAVFVPFPIKAITNVRVNGVAARTSPSVTVDDRTLRSDRTFGTIKFAVSNLAQFHRVPLGVPLVVAVTTLTIAPLNGSGSSSGTRTIAVPTTFEMGRNTRRLAWRVTRAGNAVGTIDYQIFRRLTGGTEVQVGSGSFASGGTTPGSGSDDKGYETTGDELIRLGIQFTSANDGSISLVFDEYTIAGGGSGAGNSPAGQVIGVVTCDVEGIADDADGTISGTAGLLLENPVDVGAFIMRSLYGVAAGDLDASWATTRTKLANAGYRWAFMLGFQQFSELRRALSEQARSSLRLSSGKVGFTFLSYRPAADKTFDYAREIAAMSIRLTPRTDLVAGITVKSQFDETKDAYQRSQVFGDPVVAAALPAWELPFVQDGNTASDLGAFRYGWGRRQRFDIDATTFHNALALEQVDHVAFTGHPALEGHGGGAVVCRVLRKRDIPLAGQIQLGTIDATIEGDIGSGEALMAWGSRGLKGKNNASTPNSQFDVIADAVILRNASNLIVIRHDPGSLTLSIATAGPVANGRDQAGAFSNDSWLHVYWIWDTAGTLSLIGSATPPPDGPTFPTGYTYWSYVGAFRLDGSGNIVRSLICGDLVTRVAVDLQDAAVTVNTEQSWDGSAAWPPNAKTIMGTWAVLMDTASDSAALRSITGVAAGLLLEATAADSYGGHFEIPVDGQTLYGIQSDNASREWRLKCSGYRVPNGGM